MTVLDKGIARTSGRNSGDSSIGLFDQVAPPFAVLRKTQLEHNSRWMREMVKRSGVDLAPHGKTTMSPDIFRMQIDDGAWGITLSTLAQVRVAYHFGIRRIFLANILTSRIDIEEIYALLESDREFEIYCLVDSEESIRRIADCFKKGPESRAIKVLVELGYEGGRTGCRTPQQALALAQKAQQSGAGIQLVGVEGFEGLIRAGSPEEKDRLSTVFVEKLARLAMDFLDAGYGTGSEFIVSAGGSSCIDLVAEGLKSVRVKAPHSRLLLRSGCYITSDSGEYLRHFQRMAGRGAEGFERQALPGPALEIWGHVISRPEKSRLIVGLGKRDLGNDAAMPVLVKWYRPGLHDLPVELNESGTIVELNDQHAHVIVNPESALSYGDFVGLGISHPCTTFDKWRHIQLVDDAYRSVGVFWTYF